MAMPKNQFGVRLQSPGNREFIAKILERIKANLTIQQFEVEVLPEKSKRVKLTST